MNYIVMDLEWNQSYSGHIGEHPRMPFEIIEIGAVKVDKNYRIIDEYSSLIKPRIYKKLHSKIRTILNYDETDLAKGRGFKEVCTEFLEWCGKDYIFCTWGPMDLTELQTNMAFYYMDKLPRPLKFLNLQQIYANMVDPTGSTVSKLEKAVADLQRELKIEKATNKLVFSLIIEAVNKLSPKQNVGDVLMDVLKEVTPPEISSAPDAHEAIKRVEKIIQKKQPRS